MSIVSMTGLPHGETSLDRDHRRPKCLCQCSTSVTDGIERAMEQAKTAAGDKRVTVHGARTAQLALEAGVLDEQQINVIPVLFGAGRRLFEVLPSRIELDIVRVIDTPKATHIRYRVCH